MLDDAIANLWRELIDDSGMNRGRRGERPAVFSFALHHVDNAVRELFHDAPLGFVFDPCPFRDRIHLAWRRAARKPAGLVSHLVLVTPVRFGGVEGLDELEARAARRRCVYSIGFEGAAIRHDDERSRCHVAKMVRRPEAIRFDETMRLIAADDKAGVRA